MQLKPLVSLLAAMFAAPAVLASPSGIVISQVYGGGGNTGATYKQDFIEIFNASTVPVSIGGWSVQYAAAASASWAATAIPAGVTLQPGQYYLIREAAGTGGTVDVVGDITGTLALSGTTGKVALAKNTTVFTIAAPAAEDIISWGPTATPTEGSVAAVLTNTTAHLRVANGCTDTNNNASDFAAGTPAPRNTASPLNPCGGAPVNQPIVPSCPDSSAASGAASTFNVTAVDADSRVTSAAKIESPNPWPTGITLGTFTASSANGVAATQAIEVSASQPAGVYTLNLKWDNNDAQTASCTFKVSVAGTVTIPAIQGSGARSPMEGQTVTTSGVVTKVTNAGFFMQDPVGDGDPSTSDGIYVFTSTAPTVAEGQLVRLSATVTEYAVGTGAGAVAAPLTELTNVSGLTVLGSGYQITPADVNLATLAAGGLEAYEGMLVRFRGPLTVQQNYFLGRYGQLTVAAGGRVYTPTHVYRPGADALALQAENARRSFLLDDGSSLQNVNPTPYIGTDNTVRAGDTLEEVTGVLDFGLATATTSGAVMYRLQPTAAPVIARSNPRDAAPPVSGGNVRIASANVLNFFTTFTDGTNYLGQSGQGCTLGSATSASNCRGADSLLEFQRQRAKIVANLSGLNADVVGLMEIQNNGNTAVQHLVDSLNTVMGANTYAVVPLPSQGTGTDAIRVAMIYKPGKLTLNGVSISDPSSVNNRPTFAQSFSTPNGSKFAVLVNHLKSKGSCPSGSGVDADDGLQGCWNNTRLQQANQLKTFLAQVQATTGTPDAVMLGDFNAHQKEDPIDALLSGGAIVDAVSSFDPLDWSYIFDGGSGRLDHGFVTASLAPKLAFATSWHINADEPTIIDYNLEFKQPACATCGPDYYTPTAFRSSDHDPMLMGLNLVKYIGGNGQREITGTPGDDLIEGGTGAQTITGNGGRDQFIYGSMLDAGDVITDFKPGIDKLIVTRVLTSLGIVSADPLGTGHVTCTASAAGAVIGIDADGAAGPVRSRPLLQLKNVSCSAINAASFKF